MDNTFLPFWLHMLHGEKTFRVVRLPDWQRHLANESCAAPALFTSRGSLRVAVDGFDDAFVERELISRGATVYTAELKAGDSIYIPTGALHGGSNRFASDADDANGVVTVAMTVSSGLGPLPPPPSPRALPPPSVLITPLQWNAPSQPAR